MRAVLACVAMLVATRAYADDPVPAPAPVPTLPGIPSPTTPPATPAPSDSAPAPDKAPPPEQPADPAYAEKPDPQYANSTGAQVDTNYGPRAGRDIYIKAYPDRTQRNIVGLSIAGGVSLLVGGVGLYFHLDSRSKAESINAHAFTGETWTSDRQDTYDAAHSSAVKAGVFYGIGGALLLGTAIAYIVTEPKMETIVIHPHTAPRSQALVAPLRGGALVGQSWSF